MTKILTHKTENTFVGTDTITATWLVSVILIASITYQALLTIANTHLFRITHSLIELAEVVIYLTCITILFRRIRPDIAITGLLVVAYLLVLAIVRHEVELSGLRNAIIPILFYWLGRNIGNVDYADRILKIAIGIVLFFGFFELFFLDWYIQLFDIFSYYVNGGVIQVTSDLIQSSSLNLNGMRPEGIGRTILPSLLGSHRISSVFLEPVSLGNFAVIVAAWGLSKQRDEFHQMLFFVGASVIMIALADSRYGMVTVALLMIMRLLPIERLRIAVSMLPLLTILMLVLIGMFYQGQYEDNFIGRLYSSGRVLVNFNLEMVLGLASYNTFFFDQGYAILLTRVGVLLMVLLWMAFWMIPMQDVRGERFRTYITIYISLILCVSGTALFALKTAGILWFLMGSYARLEQRKPVISLNSTNYRPTTPKVINDAH
jgi:putative polymerase